MHTHSLSLSLPFVQQVRDAWDVKSGPGLAKAWTHIMQRYWERLGESAAESAAHETPAAVAGELASAPAHMAPGAEDGPVSRVCPALEEERASYPPGGYWALNPAQRLRMLHALMHDALDTWHLRRVLGRRHAVGWVGALVLCEG